MIISMDNEDGQMHAAIEMYLLISESLRTYPTHNLTLIVIKSAIRSRKPQGFSIFRKIAINTNQKKMCKFLSFLKKPTPVGKNSLAEKGVPSDSTPR